MTEKLGDTGFWVLAALAEGRSHGYAITEAVRRISEGDVELRVPTLYAALERLRERGMVEDDGDEVVSGRLRRYFRLTEEGLAALRAEIEALQRRARHAQRAARAVGMRAD